MHHKCTRMMKTKKYLRESYYHRIECTAATFLAAFMLRRPLNSAVWVTTTHRKPESVSDRTGPLVEAQMINKCRIIMDQRELYNVRDPPWGRDQETEKEHCSNQNYTCTLFSWFIWTLASSNSEFIQFYVPCSCLIIFNIHISRCLIH